MVNESVEREPYLVVVSWPGTISIQVDASIQRIRMTIHAKSAAEARMIASLALSFMGLCGGKVTYVRKMKVIDISDRQMKGE